MTGNLTPHCHPVLSIRRACQSNKISFSLYVCYFLCWFFSTYLLSYVQALCLGCYFTLTWMAVRFARRVYSSDYIDHLSFEKSWRGELAYADHYWPYCSDFTVCDFLQSWVCAWKAWFQDAKITAHRPEKTWAVIYTYKLSGEPSSVAPFYLLY